MITVYITIGNSDDKLGQSEWAHFYQSVQEAIREDAHRVHGRWLSDGASPWQNACWCIEVEDTRVARLRDRLGKQARSFKQDSIAWAEAPKVEFLSAGPS